MSDIFLSYDSRDLERIKPLATALTSQGWTVFYDRTIPPGKTWRQFIGKEIDACGCMVVAWSKYSIDSHWVCEEADDGLKRHILVPFLLDQVRPPLGFRFIQAADLVNWRDDKNAPGFSALCGAVTELIGTKHVSPIPPGTMSSSAGQLIENHRTSETTGDGEIVKNSKPAANSGSLINPPVSQSTAPESKGSSKSSQAFIEPQMIIIPAGSFQMGGTDDDEKPIHTVTFSKPFGLGTYPVTFAEYDAFVEQTGRDKPDDEGWGRDRRPVINVRWRDACNYTAWLSQISGKAYRLPSEAEWEYACRAGSHSQFFWGYDDSLANEYAWFATNSNQKTHPVGEKRANPWELHDITGNVWEWVQDTWHTDYQGAPSDGSAWESGDNSQRVLRGGSWNDRSNDLRSASRYGNYAGYRYDLIGFRLAQDLP